MKFKIFNRIKNAFKKKQYALPANLSGPAKEIIAIIDEEIAKSAEFGLEILEEHQLKEKHVILLVILELGNISGPRDCLTFDVAMQFFSEAILRALEDESQYYFDKLKKEGRMANMYQAHLHSVAGRILNTIYDKKLTQRYYIYLGDKLTDSKLKNQKCHAVLREDGKCIRAGSKMLVEFSKYGKKVVLARRLRKINKS